jgi:hypothetical protein
MLIPSSRVLYEVSRIAHKRCMTDEQDLRVYTIWRAEISHFKTQHMSYRKTGTEVSSSHLTSPLSICSPLSLPLTHHALPLRGWTSD